MAASLTKSETQNTPSIKLWRDAELLLKDYHFPVHKLSAGVGYGKTQFDTYWLHDRIAVNGGGYNYAVVAPTYKLLKGVNLDFLQQHLLNIGLVPNVDFRINLGDMSATFTHSEDKIFFVTADNYKTILAYTLAGIVIDEPGWMSGEVLTELVKRLRADCQVLQMLYSGVPQGTGAEKYFADSTGPKFRNHGTYTVYDKYYGEQTKTRFRYTDSQLIMHGSTHENPLLPEQYIDMMYEDFGWSENLWRQQVHGEFVSSSVNTLYDFDSSKHVDDFYDLNCPLWLSWDFNVGQVTWLLCGEYRGVFHAFDENGSDAQDTHKACEQFIKRFPQLRGRTIVVVGDSSGKSKDTRSGADDYRIIANTLKSAGYDPVIKAKNYNPHLSVSFIATNRLFNQGKAMINRRCKLLIYSLQATQPDGRVQI